MKILPICHMVAFMVPCGWNQRSVEAFLHQKWSVCHLENTVGNILLTTVAELKAEAILGRTEMLAC